jgi:hypothetical protein
MELGFAIEPTLQINDLYIPYLELDNGTADWSRLCFRGCFFSTVALDAELNAAYLPRFEGCYIDGLEGRSSRNDLPPGVFDHACEFDRFSEAPLTTNAIVAMDLPVGTKVMLTVLRKIYLRRGSGRKENALHRGLDHHGRRLLPFVLRLLQAEGLVMPYRRGGMDMPVWLPDRAQTARAMRMVTSPRTCKDPLLDKTSDLV